ncbi:branched-chain amino acid aminotransferase [Paraflavisolibacter sp. H34]|uniref:branched-chain amino acid aminotransferase n=1 Tax=Huijunlia imazamoxiresistens TaxID=3127457 RepID=UPI003015F9B0
MEIPVTKAERSKLKDLNLENISFGRYFTDHVLEADYINGEWTNVGIRPYHPLVMDPSAAVLHYGQAIFEGIKAYKDENGDAFIFRPHDNYSRFNISAARMEMPAVPEEIFMQGMKQLVALEKDWIPRKPDYSLYIRPFMFATDEMIGVKPSDTYKFMILLSPTGPYYSAPMRIYVEEFFVRAVRGGIGYAKAAGNYAACLHPTQEAKKKGYDQILWTDPVEHKYVQEIGTMNIIFIIGNTAVTPGLEEGTILNGVTRQSVLTILKEMGLGIEERPVSIDEIMEAFRAGQLREVFGTGTAATVSPIKELRYKDFVMHFDIDQWQVMPGVKQWLDDIRSCKKEDKYGWMVKV